MMPGGAAALAAIDAIHGETVAYNGAGLTSAPIIVIWSDSAGAPFQGSGNTTRTITAEIRRGRLPQRPGSTNRLVRNGVTWKPIEILEREDVDAWELTLEKVA